VPETETLRFLSHNVLYENERVPAVAANILQRNADVVALQELEPGTTAAIDADTDLRARYPYRLLAPDAHTAGMGLLATRPLIAGDLSIQPLIQRAGLRLDDGRLVELLNVHPYPPGFRVVWGLPVSLDTRRRDEDLARIARSAAGLEIPASALVVGDLNTTSTEPGFGVLTERLVDAHTAVGVGPGFTWRPGPLQGEGLGFLRIDHVLAGAWFTPVASGVDCAAKGDHCRLSVTLRVATTAPGTP
jgi:endonuclease/exonuclease/phosphatase (EEP) superfamily protein YafD